MISFEGVTVEDFLSFKGSSLILDRPGVVLVLGENLDNQEADSNGSGKSALLCESIVYGLFGQTLRGVSGADVIRRGAEKAFVSVTFSSNGKKYRVDRSQTPKSGSLALFCNSENISKSKRETQLQVEELLGLDFGLFCQSVILGQDSLLFATSTDAEKKRLLEKITGTEQFEAYRKRAVEKVREWEEKVRSKSSELDTKKAAAEVLEENIIFLKKKRDEFEDEKASSLKRLGDEVSKLRESLETRNSLKEKLVEVDRKRAELKGVDKLYRALEKDYSVICIDLGKRESSLSAAKKDRDKAERACSEIKDSCPTCKRPFDPASLEEARKKAAVELESCVKKVEGEERLLKHVQERSEEKEEEKRKAKEEVDSLKSLDETRSVVMLSIERLASVDGQIERLQSEIRDVDSKGCPFSQEIKEKEARLVEMNSLMKGLESEIQSCEEVLPYWNFWVRAFGPKGLKSYIFDAVVGFLNERANHYSKILTGGDIEVQFSTQRKLKTKDSMAEDFHVEGLNRFGADVYRGNSAGERQRVDLAIALGLQDLARSRSAVAFNISLFDEVFVNMDQSGQECVLSLLRELEKNRTIFVITHQDNLKEAFSKVLTVRKKGGISEVLK